MGLGVLEGGGFGERHERGVGDVEVWDASILLAR